MILYSMLIILAYFPLLCNSFQFRNAHRVVLASMRASSASLGSDALHRPDDENSPEFKRYLQQLLEQQLIRAKSGFTAPSSSSADAYIAKLNRIKLERIARRRMGLTDEVDLSYLPDDLQAAMGEAQEIQVASPQLSAGGRIARQLSSEELKLARVAADRARKALAQSHMLVVNEGTPPGPSMLNTEDTVRRDNPLTRAADLIGKRRTLPVADKLQLRDALQTVLTSTHKQVRHLDRGEQKATAEPATPPPPIPQPPAHATLSVGADKAESADVVALCAQRDRLLDDLTQVHSRIQVLQQRSALRSTVSTTVETSALLKVPNPAKSPANKDQIQQLEDLPVEKVLKLALALLLKHRGGPGFGHGRLQGPELQLLEGVLRRARDLLLTE